uniref:SLAM family member 9-like isoform X2 n=1 Tax=Pristiophorus japonicus TaxID=55135 RepID=UPI00398EE628
MFSPGSKNPPRIVISWLLLTVLNEQGGLGKVVGNLAPGHLVNGTLGQSVTLPVNIPQTELQSITWDFRNGNNGKKIQVCSKFVHNPEKCNNELGEKFRLNLNDYSLEIQTLIKSDQGLYEVNARTEQGVHEETVELRVYEGVSSPRIQISDVSSDRICNVTLSCSVESGSDLIYSWWRGDGDITADWSHRVTDNGSRLEVSLNPHDTSTVFNCTVRNPVSEKTWSVDLAHSCNITTGGDKEHKGPVLHKGIIAAITVVVILLVIGIVYAYRRKQSKPDEAPNTEGTSEQAQYAEIRKSSNARDQSQGHLRQLDASEGQHSRGVQLITIYDEIKFNPDVPTPTMAAKKGQEASANASLLSSAI